LVSYSKAKKVTIDSDKKICSACHSQQRTAEPTQHVIKFKEYVFYYSLVTKYYLNWCCLSNIRECFDSVLSVAKIRHVMGFVEL